MIDKITPLIVRTPEQNAILRKRALANGLPELIYEDFGVYANYMVPKIKVGKHYYDWEWFHWYICKNYNHAIFDIGTLLSLEIGPQVGKSILTALFVTYVFGLSPNTSIIYATYNETKAIDFTKRYVLKFMTTDKKYKKIFPHISLKFELDKKDHSNEGAAQRKTSTMKDTEFTLSNLLTKQNYNGGYRCYGISQGIHGVPADIFIIDDYVDKGDTVRSEVFKSKLREWFYNDVPSRLQDISSILIAICTRWYRDDIIGMLHQSYDEDIIPALEKAEIAPPKLNKVRIRAEYRISDDNPVEDPRTENGELLWKAHLLKYALAKRGIFYAAMYNCDTSEEDDASQLKEDDFGYYLPGELPEVGKKYVVIDGASTTGKRSDYTAIGLWMVLGRKKYLVKGWLIRLEIPALIRFVLNILLVEHPDYYQCLIEFANSGIALCQELKDRGLRHIPLNFFGKPLVNSQFGKKEPTDLHVKQTSKMDRYLKAIPEITQQDKPIMLPAFPVDESQKEFLKNFILQVCNFTGEKNKPDDCVDMLSYFIIYTSSNTVYAVSGIKKDIKKVDNRLNMQYNLPKEKYFLNT